MLSAIVPPMIEQSAKLSWGRWVLRPMDLHIWQAPLDLAAQKFSMLTRLLSIDEQARAARMRIVEKRRAYMVARATLRAILGMYLHCAPAAIKLTYNRFGKPFLAAGQTTERYQNADTPAAQARLEFSVAHSGNMAVYALATQRVGIDVEQVRLDPDVLSIARRFLATREQQTLLALPAGIQRQAFFRCWTRKEAYAKACGMGLYLPFEQFAVACRPDEPAGLEAVAPDAPLAATAPERWRFWDLPLRDGYVGAVAVENPICELTYCGEWVWERVGLFEDVG